MNPPTISLTTGNAHALRQNLAALCTAADVRYAAVVQEAGVVITDCGDSSYRDHGETGALATAAFCSARELASRLGESLFTGLHYDGGSRHFFLASLTREFFLLCIFGNNTCIAIVRACVTRVVPALAAGLSHLNTDTPLPSDFQIGCLDDSPVLALFNATGERSGRAARPMDS